MLVKSEEVGAKIPLLRVAGFPEMTFITSVIGEPALPGTVIQEARQQVGDELPVPHCKSFVGRFY